MVGLFLFFFSWSPNLESLGPSSVAVGTWHMLSVQLLAAMLLLVVPSLQPCLLKLLTCLILQQVVATPHCVMGPCVLSCRLEAGLWWVSREEVPT